jgi:hypothetical protein
MKQLSDDKKQENLVKDLEYEQSDLIEYFKEKKFYKDDIKLEEYNKNFL